MWRNCVIWRCWIFLTFWQQQESPRLLRLTRMLLVDPCALAALAAVAEVASGSSSLQSVKQTVDVEDYLAWPGRYHLHTEDHRSQAQELEERLGATETGQALLLLWSFTTLCATGFSSWSKRSVVKSLTGQEEFYVSPQSVFAAAMETLSEIGLSKWHFHAIPHPIFPISFHWRER